MQKKLQNLMSLSKADYCDIRVEDTEITNISYRGRELEKMERKIQFGGCIRTLIGSGWGFISFNSLDNLEEKLRQAEDQARTINRVKKGQVQLAPAPVIIAEEKNDWGEDPRQISLKEKLELMQHYNNLILNTDSRVNSSRIVYFDHHTDWFFASSSGTYIYQEKGDIGGNLGAWASAGQERTYDAVTFGSNNDFSVARGHDEQVVAAARRAVEQLQAPTVRGGQYPVILDPEMAGLFVHEAFGHLSEADEIFDDKNLLQLMQPGTRYGPSFLNIYDSGREWGNRGASHYDDEGLPTQKTYLIQNGEVVGHLHSRESAARMETEPTGSARAMDYRFPPICRMRTTCIEPGLDTLEDMISGIDYGLYAIGGLGGETNGELFTFTATRGQMIRNGKLAEQVKNVTLTGNVFHTLNNIDSIGQDFAILNNAGGCGKFEQSPLPTSEGSPHIRVQNVIVGGEG